MFLEFVSVLDLIVFFNEASFQILYLVRTVSTIDAVHNCLWKTVWEYFVVQRPLVVWRRFSILVGH